MEFEKALEPAWCPGCGNFAVREAVMKALNESGFKKSEVVMVSGIGQAAKMPHYIDVNFFNGLHGRALPAATGLKLANPRLKVLAESGEGCNYGEGGNHFLAAIRRNINITLLVHDNQIYGLTKGQASPTTDMGQFTKTSPQGVMNQPFQPLSIAIATGCGFVARGFSGEIAHLADLIIKAMRYPGFALVDILSPCISFNKSATFASYKKRAYKLDEARDPSNLKEALELAAQWEDKIPIGLIYRRDPQGRPPLEDKIAQGRNETQPLVLAGHPPSRERLLAVMEKFKVH